MFVEGKGGVERVHFAAFKAKQILEYIRCGMWSETGDYLTKSHLNV